MVEVTFACIAGSTVRLYHVQGHDGFIKCCCCCCCCVSQAMKCYNTSSSGKNACEKIAYCAHDTATKACRHRTYEFSDSEYESKVRRLYVSNMVKAAALQALYLTQQVHAARSEAGFHSSQQQQQQRQQQQQQPHVLMLSTWHATM
jgi:hypothetical protein